MIRLFTAIAVPPQIAEEVTALFSGLDGARWAEPGDLHITLRFIGDIDERVADDVADELWDVEGRPFQLRLEGVGQFSKGHMLHTVYAAVSKSAALLQLQRRNEAAARRAGLDPEPRKFLPHVTIARTSGADPVDVMRYIERCNLFRSSWFDVTEFVLYSTKPGQGGAPYVPECTYPLS